MFIIFIDEVLLKINKIIGRNDSNWTYADDITIVAYGVNQIIDLIHNINLELKKIKLQLNKEKSLIMKVGKRNLIN